MRGWRLGCLVAAACVAAVHAREIPEDPKGAPSEQAEPHSAAGYLSPAQRPDGVALLGPPPPAGSGAKLGDLATYWGTRRLQGSARWELASRDAAFGAEALLFDFSCALDVNLTRRRAPILFRLLDRVVTDDDASAHDAKRIFQRPRPFQENGGPICVPEADWLKRSYSYPSGHSTFSWTAALILAELAPDRATAILRRARIYADSRVVCGVHYVSDVQAGRLLGSAVYGALQASAEFRRDLADAKRELAALRQETPTPAECAFEHKADAEPLW